jgi:hypothetical protein
MARVGSAPNRPAQPRRGACHAIRRPHRADAGCWRRGRLTTPRLQGYLVGLRNHPGIGDHGDVGELGVLKASGATTTHCHHLSIVAHGGQLAYLSVHFMGRRCRTRCYKYRPKISLPCSQARPSWCVTEAMSFSPASIEPRWMEANPERVRRVTGHRGRLGLLMAALRRGDE